MMPDSAELDARMFNTHRTAQHPAGLPADLADRFIAGLIGDMPTEHCMPCGWAFSFPSKSLDPKLGESRWDGLRKHLAEKHPGAGR